MKCHFGLWIQDKHLCLFLLEIIRTPNSKGIFIV
uniref:Uncharacterized protein n=1 Tax=Arundo donax TaxID=35708 RepID=A0A0A9H0P0_ARUDO